MSFSSAESAKKPEKEDQTECDDLMSSWCLYDAFCLVLLFLSCLGEQYACACSPSGTR